MSHTCGVCDGALPNGVEPEVHTALCAQVLAEELIVARRELNEAKEALKTLRRNYDSLADNPIFED